MTRAAQELPPLVVVTGKGGVGKTLVSCALARSRVAAGERVLLLELGARESLHRFLGCAPSGGRVVGVEPGLDAQNLRPRDVVDRLIEERVRPAWAARRVLKSVIYEQFVQGAPGLREVAALGYAMRAIRGETGSGSRYDRVFLDAPATGHGVSLLQAPKLLSEAIGSGPVAALAREVAQMIADPAASGLWAVSTVEGMALRETLELDEALDRGIGRRLDLLLLNKLLPAAEKSDEASAWLAEWRRRAESQATSLSALDGLWKRPRVLLPLGAGEGPAALDEVERALATARLA